MADEDDYERWKATQRQGVDNTFGVQDTSREAYDALLSSQAKQQAAMAEAAAPESSVAEPSVAEQYGEIYATPNRAQQAAQRAYRSTFGAPQLGNIEATAGKQLAPDPISTIAQEATGGAMFGRLGRSWQAAKRALGFGDEAAEGATKAVAKTATSEATQKAPEWAANWTPQLGQKMKWSHPMSRGLDPGQTVHVIDKGDRLIDIAPKAYAYPKSGSVPGATGVVPGGLMWRILVEGDEHAAKQLEKLTGRYIPPSNWHPVIRPGQSKPKVQSGDYVTMFSPGVELQPVLSAPVTWVSEYLR
ncbi:MAG: hypothetical protein GOVbin1923_27 [Prokaryotic dsDNA virus sp.]|nr:MAG: hypothetical protein GOVbin1923_27 [Prokaryotic dsDNA virus sp.]|tara:strand:- start:4650 stop:5555 length:906 start_codon:yes stop_codon:yes gene_type:complete